MNDEIIAIKNRIFEQLKPEKLYLFGSYARGSFDAQSDYDFYIVMPDNTQDLNAVSTKAYMSLRGLKRRPVDFIVDTKSNFEHRAKMDTLEKTVFNEGIVLYA